MTSRTVSAPLTDADSSPNALTRRRMTRMHMTVKHRSERIRREQGHEREDKGIDRVS
jgi:hypothetical protein